MNYARVINGVVFEVIDFDPTNRYHPSLLSEFIPCDDTVQQHYIYDEQSKSFHAPTKTVQELANLEIELIKSDLQYLDKTLSRNLEDIINFQIDSGLFTEQQLPMFVQNNRLKKQQLRARLKELGG